MSRAERETARWAREVGLDASKRPDNWEIELVLQAKRNAKVVAVLSLQVWVDSWVVTLHHGTAEAFYSLYRDETESHRKMPIAPPRRLADVRAWIARLEKKLGAPFERDKAVVRSKALGGKKAALAWITEAA